MERTFIMIKPDGVQRGLIGEIIRRFEAKGFTLSAMKFVRCSREHASNHYEDLRSRPFFHRVTTFLSSGPVVAMLWTGANVVKAGRKMIGATNPMDSAPGTIRGDFTIDVGRNVIHGSDSVEAAEREISLWFRPEEIVEYESTNLQHVYV